MKRWSIIPAALLVLAGSFSELSAQLTFTESFTSTTYKDTANTIADWNTTAGELRLLPFAITNVGSYDTPGFALDVAVSGDYAFVADNPDVVTFDIIDPANPTILSTFAAGDARAISPHGDLLYIAAGTTGLTIVDVSDPASPTQLGNLSVSTYANDVAVEGDVAYVADGTFGLIVVDVSDPAAPVQIGSYATVGNAVQIDMSGDHCYVAHTSGGGIVILDVSDPTTPTLAGGAVLSGEIWSIVVDGNLAYVGAQVAGLSILDVSDPANPTVLGSVGTGTDVYNMAVSGDVVHAVGSGLLRVIDVSSSSTPAVIESWASPGTPWAVAVAGEHAFVADGSGGGLQVLRVRAALSSPIEVGFINTPSETFRVAVAGDHAFVADTYSGLRVIDISDPASPAEIGFVDTPSRALAVALAGDLAFVADDLSGLRVIDISIPTGPVELGFVDTPGEAFDVAVAGDHAFVADYAGGLRVIDVSNPSSPIEIGFVATVDYAQSVVVSGDHAFVADSYWALRIIDISNPASPVEVGLISTPEPVYDVAVAGDHAFLADAFAGLRVIDISNPASPVEIGFIDTPGQARGVAVTGDNALVADHSGGLRVIDVSDPTSPTETGFFGTSQSAYDVAISGDHVIVADGVYGLRIIRVFENEVANPDNDQGQSLIVDSGDDKIVRTRLTTAQTNAVSWQLSANDGANWQTVAADGTWNPVTVPGVDLLWRANLAWSPGAVPGVDNLQLDWFVEPAIISSIADIPNDQGRQVRVEWLRSGHDFVGDPQQIVEYAVYRQIDPNLTSVAGLKAPRERDGLSPVARAHAELMLAAGWDFLLTIPVRVEDYYAVVVPTLADSTIIAGPHLTTFLVSALTATPGVYFDSHPDGGYSVDNLAPGVPQGVAVAYNTGSGNTLSWDPAAEPDFQFCRVYRATDPNFVPTPGDLVHETAMTGWTDPDFDGGAVYYRITAIDFSGNESDPAGPDVTSAAGGAPPPQQFALLQNAPNPFNPTTTIRYDAPAGGGAVSLRVYDVRGAHVRTLADGVAPPGSHSVVWNGRNQAGRSVPSGVYFYRLEAPGYTKTRKMVLVE